MDASWTFRAAAAAGLTAAVLGIMHSGARLLEAKPDPRFATPQRALQAYIDAVLAVDEEAELATGTASVRSRSERYRGPDKAFRKEGLAGKASIFRDFPIVVDRVAVWEDRAKIRVSQGGTPEYPLFYVYTFLLERGEWKIDNIEKTWDMRW